MDPFEIDLLKDILITLFEPSELMKFVRESDFRAIRFPNGLEFYLKGQEFKYEIVCNHPSEIPVRYLLALRELKMSNMFADFSLVRQIPSSHHVNKVKNG